MLGGVGGYIGGKHMLKINSSISGLEDKENGVAGDRNRGVWYVNIV